MAAKLKNGIYVFDPPQFLWKSSSITQVDSKTTNLPMTSTKNMLSC